MNSPMSNDPAWSEAQKAFDAAALQPEGNPPVESVEPSGLAT
jgi:hypothetical protein